MPDAFGSVWPQYNQGWLEKYGLQPAINTTPRAVASAPAGNPTPQTGQRAATVGNPRPQWPEYVVPQQRPVVVQPVVQTSAPFVGQPIGAPPPGRLAPQATEVGFDSGQSTGPPFVGQPIGADDGENYVPGIYNPYQPAPLYPSIELPEVTVSGTATRSPQRQPAPVTGPYGGGYDPSIPGYVAPSPVAGQSGYVYPNYADYASGASPPTAAPVEPNLAQRFLQSLSHLFQGTLGQNQTPVLQALPPGSPASGGMYAEPTTGGVIGASPGAGESGYVYPSGASAAVGAAAPFVGQPIGAGQQPGTPEQNPSELGGTSDTGLLAGSGAGEPQTRYNMGSFNTGLTNVGGFSGQGGTGGTGVTNALGALTSALGGGGGGGGGAGGGGGGGGGLMSGLQNLFGQGPSSGAGSAGTGLGGSGISAGSLASAITGILSSFAKTSQEANAPVSINPSEWANPPPAPATFSWPQLSPNQGGTWYT
jgi:hypothetical protein